MSESETQPYTVILEATGPLGPGVQVVHQEAAGASEAALRALQEWLGEPYDPDVELHELEMRAYVLAVLHGGQALRRVPPGRLAV